MCRCRYRDDKIHIPAKKVRVNEQGVIRLTPSATEALMEVVSETDRSIREIASLIIEQAIDKNLIVFDREV